MSEEHSHDHGHDHGHDHDHGHGQPEEDGPRRLATPMATTITMQLTGCSTDNVRNVISRIVQTTQAVIVSEDRMWHTENGFASATVSLAVPYPSEAFDQLAAQAAADKAAAAAAAAKQAADEAAKAAAAVNGEGAPEPAAEAEAEAPAASE